MLRLTEEQVLAAATPGPLVNIISEPGSGKTTVAAERFGYERYSLRSQRGVLGLSFTRSAAEELGGRVRRRWGGRALDFPHRVATLDQLHVELLKSMIAAGLVKWPSASTPLDVRDSYAGFTGYRWLPEGGWRRGVALAIDGRAYSCAVQITRPQYGMGPVREHRALLEVGVVSHEDVRQVLEAAFAQPAFRDHTSEWLSANYRAIVVDEIYDAARLDLLVLALAASADVRLTLIGDPWQALYGWRGATPALVAQLLDAPEPGFISRTLSQSFRFLGDQMPTLAAALRRGEGITLPAADSSEVDIALARTWAPLWKVGVNVLPLAFHTVTNRTDAALTLLLDLMTRSRLRRSAFGRREAITMLGLDLDQANEEQETVLQPVLDQLRAGSTAEDALTALRSTVSTWAQVPAIRRLKPAAELRQLENIRQLARRLDRPSLIPGLTVFQAKGQEWPRVGVALSGPQMARLRDGLHELGDEDCILYVALTRAISSVGQLKSD